MGVSYIPGPDIGAALAQIASSIGTIAKPNAQFQREFQKAIASRPELMQQLADMEGKSPGTLESFEPIIGEGLAAALRGILPSAGAMKEHAIQQNFDQVANTPTDMLGNLPQTPGMIATTAYLTGARPQQLQEEQHRSEELVAAGDFVSHMTADEKTELGVHGSEDILKDPQFIQRLILNRAEARERRADTINNYMKQKEIANASWWQEKMGVGTMDDWLNFFSPKGKARINAIEQGSPPKPEDSSLMQVAAAFESAPTILRASFLNQTSDNIRQLIPAIAKADGTARAALIANLNSVLISGGSKIVAKWTTSESSIIPNALQRNRLRFFDENNKELDPEVALQLYKTGGATTRQKTPDEWAAEVLHDHPEWRQHPELVAAEARKRAGVRR